MYKLNLPEFEYTLRKADGKVWIFDVIRKKFVVLTPEEWVRQHFVQHLITGLRYPKALIKLEGGLKYNTLNKRTDIVVYDRKGEPWMVVECKSPELKISESVLRQASVYNTTLKAKYITISNGLKHYCCSMDWQLARIVMMRDLPVFDEMDAR
jgi:hypothetical protein